MDRRKHRRLGICARTALGALALAAGLAAGLAAAWALEGIGLLTAVPSGLLFAWLTPELWRGPDGGRS